jgi:hypothetical protein
MFNVRNSYKLNLVEFLARLYYRYYYNQAVEEHTTYLPKTLVI